MDGCRTQRHRERRSAGQNVASATVSPRSPRRCGTSRGGLGSGAQQHRVSMQTAQTQAAAGVRPAHRGVQGSTATGPTEADPAAELLVAMAVAARRVLKIDAARSVARAAAGRGARASACDRSSERRTDRLRGSGTANREGPHAPPVGRLQERNQRCPSSGRRHCNCDKLTADAKPASKGSGVPPTAGKAIATMPHCAAVKQRRPQHQRRQSCADRS